MWRCGVKYELNWFKLIRFADGFKEGGFIEIGNTKCGECWTIVIKI